MKPADPILKLNKYIEEYCINQFLEILDPKAAELISSFSMRPYVLTLLKNEIILNKRKNILEFGSGLSTIFMALIIKKYGLNSSIISVENDINWVNRLNEKIDLLDLQRIVRIVHAPLVADFRKGLSGKWYDSSIVENETTALPLFDLVIIDGPPAYEKDSLLNRYGAIPFVYPRLSESFTILLDDADRKGEKQLQKLWESEFSLLFAIYNHRTAISRKGPYINSHPSLISAPFFKPKTTLGH